MRRSLAKLELGSGDESDGIGDPGGDLERFEFIYDTSKDNIPSFALNVNIFVAIVIFLTL